MFGSSSTSEKDAESSLDGDSSAVNSDAGRPSRNNVEKSSNGNPLSERTEGSPAGERKRRSGGVAKARDIFSNARQSLHLRSSSPKSSDSPNRSTFRVLSESDPALGVPQGSMNNSAGESVPGPRSTFRVGVTEDKNKKCRRTMEDTHAYLYNFLSTPAPAVGGEVGSKVNNSTSDGDEAEPAVQETDNGYFAIFDGHAGTFAADWCGKKLHHILEDTIRKNPSTPLPELLDQTFTIVDQQLEKLPLKNSGCTAAIAVLRWEDRVPNPASATGSTYINQATTKSTSEPKEPSKADSKVDSEVPASQPNSETPTANAEAVRESISSDSRLKDLISRQRVLYTANVGDARIVLCRNGRALRLSYDHKGSDENEGRRVANAGGLILNNRVNGVLAVTRALGDAYMKDLVTGHPYTTETVIQPDQDEFIILACDGLWDVCSDQEAVDLVRHMQEPQAASKKLVDHALARFSTDNLSCMIVRFDNEALKARRMEASIGVQGDLATGTAGESEADALVEKAKRFGDETGEMADIPEEGEREMGEGGGETRFELHERVLEEARDRASKHGDGGGDGGGGES